MTKTTMDKIVFATCIACMITVTVAAIVADIKMVKHHRVR